MKVPTVSLGGLEVSRFILGGNPFAGFSHQSRSRDAEMRGWYTAERVVETLFQAEALGVTAVVARGDEHMARCLECYRRRGGRMHWIAQTASEAATPAAGARFCIDRGAAACFIHGGVVDHLVAHSRFAELVAAVDAIKAAGLPAGIAGHELEDFQWAEENLDLDFYMACYYRPTPRQDAPQHVPGAAERFDIADRDARVALIRTLSRPAIHYKILAAGRTPPAAGFAFAAKQMRPGDAVCVGVYTQWNRGMIREDLELLLANLRE